MELAAKVEIFVRHALFVRSAQKEYLLLQKALSQLCVFVCTLCF